MSAWRGVIEEYRDHLPVSDATPVVTHEPYAYSPERAEAIDANGELATTR